MEMYMYICIYIYIHISPLPLGLLSHPLSHPSRSSRSSKLSSLCYTAASTSYLFHTCSVYTSIPFSQFIPPAPSPLLPRVLMCVLYTYVSILVASVARGRNWGSEREMIVPQINVEWAYFHELLVVFSILQMQPEFPSSQPQIISSGFPWLFQWHYVWVLLENAGAHWFPIMVLSIETCEDIFWPEDLALNSWKPWTVPMPCLPVVNK